jgi:hypothetical protein
MLKVTKKLIASGLVIEIKAKAGAPVWRRDEENAQSYALQLTASGLRAIVVDDGAAQEGAGELSSSSGANPPTAETVTMPIGYGPGADEALHEDGDTTNGDPSKSFEGAPTTPRTGSKLADVIALLRQHQGATIDELIAATNWLPHTTRAALTGLRKAGVRDRAYPLGRHNPLQDRRGLSGGRRGERRSGNWKRGRFGCG